MEPSLHPDTIMSLHKWLLNSKVWSWSICSHMTIIAFSKVGGAAHTWGLSATCLAQYWMILMASMLVSTNGSWEVLLKDIINAEVREIHYGWNHFDRLYFMTSTLLLTKLLVFCVVMEFVIYDPILENHPFGYNGQFSVYTLNEAPGSYLSCIKISAWYL